MSTLNRVTLRDIASRVGVSHVTVSLALSGHPRISQSRRHEVLKVAREMGYSPDPMLTSLVAYRHSKRPHQIQSALAWINHWDNPKELRKFKEFDAYWTGATKAAESFGYRLEEFVWQADTKPKRFESILTTRNICGLLIPPHRIQPDWGDFHWDRFCPVRFGTSVRTPTSNVISANQFRAISTAVEKMDFYGYKRIGFIVDADHDHALGGLWTGGFLAAQRILNLPNSLPIFEWRRAKGAEAMTKELKSWLNKYKPDAALVGVAPVLDILSELKVRIPEDLAVAALSLLDLPLDAGINQNSEEIGRVAVETVVALINSNNRGNPSITRLILVDGTWVDGNSLPNRNARTAR